MVAEASVHPVTRLRARPRLKTRVTELFGLELPIFQGAMAWLSEAELVAAVSNEGGLGVLGAAIMSVAELEDQVARTQDLTDRPFAVNFPLVLGDFAEHLEMCLDRGVRIIVMSAGSPKKLTPRIRAAGAQCIHVVPNLRLALSAERAGVDAVVLESFEAGGHVSREGITAITNIPLVSRALTIPVIAAGGLADGYGMAAALALGADGVQLGTRFLAAEESNIPPGYQRRLLDAGEGGAPVYGLQHHPGRALRSPVLDRILAMESEGASVDEVRAFIGRGRARKAAHGDDSNAGMFYAGASASLVDRVMPVSRIMDALVTEYQQAIDRAAGFLVLRSTPAHVSSRSPPAASEVSPR